MLQYERSKANIYTYTYIFQHETKQFLNKLLEFSVYSEDWLSSVLGRPLVVPSPSRWWHATQVVLCPRSSGARPHRSPSTQEPRTSESGRQDARVFRMLTREAGLVNVELRESPSCCWKLLLALARSPRLLREPGWAPLAGPCVQFNPSP